MTAEKMWNGEPFWGLGYDFDPQWVLTDAQKELQARLIQACAETLRPNAVKSDIGLVYPRANFEKLAELGLLGLFVPRKWGGLGENHVCAAMVVETIARYGCPSTAMCYTMHLGAVAALLFRAAQNPEFIPLLERLGQGRADRHPVLLGPGDGVALLVPHFQQRRAGGGRLEGQQEGVVDHVGGLRGLLRRADDQPGLSGQLLGPVVLSGLQRGGARPSRRSGTPWACAATSPGRCWWTT